MDDRVASVEEENGRREKAKRGRQHGDAIVTNVELAEVLHMRYRVRECL